MRTSIWYGITETAAFAATKEKIVSVLKAHWKKTNNKQKLSSLTRAVFNVFLLYPALVFGALSLVIALLGEPLIKGYYKELAQKVQVKTPVGQLAYEQCVKSDHQLESSNGSEPKSLGKVCLETDYYFEPYEQSADSVTKGLKTTYWITVIFSALCVVLLYLMDLADQYNIAGRFRPNPKGNAAA